MSRLEHTLFTPPRTECRGIERKHVDPDLGECWRVWIQTRDYVEGTCLLLCTDGSIWRRSRDELVCVMPVESESPINRPLSIGWNTIQSRWCVTIGPRTAYFDTLDEAEQFIGGEK